MLTLAFKAVQARFLDMRKVQAAVDKTVPKTLMKFGAFVWKRARTSLKYGERPSRVGSPPTVHRTMTRKKINRKGVLTNQSVSPLRESVLFAFDAAKTSVVIGAARLPGKRNQAPKALEYGGESLIKVIGGHGKTKSATIRRHPFMQPAFQAELPGFAQLWANSVR